MDQLSTRQAFQQLISQRNIGKSIGLSGERVRNYRLEIKNDKWPSTDFMIEKLKLAGYMVVQEMLWRK